MKWTRLCSTCSLVCEQASFQVVHSCALHALLSCCAGIFKSKRAIVELENLPGIKFGGLASTSVLKNDWWILTRQTDELDLTTPKFGACARVSDCCDYE